MSELCDVQIARAAGFVPATEKLGVAVLFDDQFWQQVEKFWRIECAAPGPLPHPGVTVIAVLNSMPPAERAALRARVTRAGLDVVATNVVDKNEEVL